MDIWVSKMILEARRIESTYLFSIMSIFMIFSISYHQNQKNIVFEGTGSIDKNRKKGFRQKVIFFNVDTITRLDITVGAETNIGKLFFRLLGRPQCKKHSVFNDFCVFLRVGKFFRIVFSLKRSKI